MSVLLGHIWAAVEVSGSVNSRSRVHQESSVVYAPRRCRESSWERNSHQRVCMSFPHLLLCRWCGNPKETPKLTWSSGHWCIFVCIYLRGRDHRTVSHWLRTGFGWIVTDEVLQLICFQTRTDLITILVNSVSIIGGSTHTSQFAHFTIFSWTNATALDHYLHQLQQEWWEACVVMYMVCKYFPLQASPKNAKPKTCPRHRSTYVSEWGVDSKLFEVDYWTIAVKFKIIHN